MHRWKMLLYVGSSKFGDCLQINEEKRAIIQLQVKEIQLRFIPVMSVSCLVKHVLEKGFSPHK